MAEKFPTPQERAMAWLLEAQEIRRHEQAGDRAVRLPTRLITRGSRQRTTTRRKPVFGRGGDSECLLAART